MYAHQERYDYILSVGVAAVIGAELSRCWRNAALAVILLPDLLPSGIYVEGWIVIPKRGVVEIIEHGWCTTPGQHIVDPTIVLTEERDQRVFYFPGYQLSRDALAGSLPWSTLPLVCHSAFGESGMQHPGYRLGFAAAMEQAHVEAKELHLPLGAIRVHSRDPRLGITVIVDSPTG